MLLKCSPLPILHPQCSSTDSFPSHSGQSSALYLIAFTRCSHCLQEWNSLYFKQTSLCALGQHIQLGHDGAACPSPNITSSLSTILHTNRIHSIYIDHCACRQAVNVNITSHFLRLGLWPATVLDPKTATTIHLLDFFHQLTLQSKVNLYDFYWSLSHLTSNTNDSLVPVRNFAFLSPSAFFAHSSSSSFDTKNSADVSVSSGTSCSSNAAVSLILLFPSLPPLLALALSNALAVHTQAAIFQIIGSSCVRKISKSSLLSFQFSAHHDMLAPLHFSDTSISLLWPLMPTSASSARSEEYRTSLSQMALPISSRATPTATF